MGGIGAEKWARGEPVASMVARSGRLRSGLLTRSTQRPAAWLRQWLSRGQSSLGRLRLGCRDGYRRRCDRERALAKPLVGLDRVRERALRDHQSSCGRANHLSRLDHLQDALLVAAEDLQRRQEDINELYHSR
jgi:hypothetical protein